MVKERISHKNPIVLLDEHLYGNCQQYCKMVAAASLGADYRIIMANDLFYFAENPELDFSIRPTIRPVMEDEPLLASVGIRQEKVFHPDPLETILTALDAHKYVMVCVDCFYYPTYAKCYQEKHRYHYFLIYGYDQTQKVFHTVEPWGFTMNTPLLQDLGYDELLINIARAKESFDLDCYVRIFSESTDKSCITVSDFYTRVFNEHYGWLSENYQHTADQIEQVFYRAVLSSGFARFRKYHGFMDRFFRHKQSQAFAYSKLIDDQQINQLFPRLLELYQHCVEETDRLEAVSKTRQDVSDLEQYAGMIAERLKRCLALELEILMRVRACIPSQ